MGQTIQIKRSSSSDVPSSPLAEGELAYGHEGTNAGKLVIGRPLDSGDTATNDVIGGKFFVDTVNNATNANTVSTIVKRNGSGNFSAGTITAALNGNASTATKLAATANIHGVAFDGSADIDLSEQIQDTVGTMFTGNTESGITVTYQDADGTIDLAVGTLNQSTTGNAATATALASNITINGNAVNGGSTLTLDADDIAEAGSPTNKYFTNARADARVEALVNHSNHSGGITVTKDSGTGELRFTGASQYADSDARGAISLHSDSTSNLGSSLAYNSSTGKFTYTAPTDNSVRSAVITATGTSGGTGYGSVSYNNSTGALDFAKVTQANIKSSVETTGLTDLTLANASTASTLTFTGVDDSSTRTFAFEGGGNSKQLTLTSTSNNIAANVFRALDFNAYNDTGYTGTNTIGIGTAAPTSVDQFNYRCEIGPNTKFLGTVQVESTIEGMDIVALNGSPSDTDNSINFNRGLVEKFKIRNNHSTNILSIEDGSAPVISIPDSNNTNPNVTVSRNTDFTGDVSVGGTLTVTGGTTTITSTTLAVGDNVISLNTDQTTEAQPTEDCGIEVKRGLVTGSSDARALAQLVFDESELEWVTIEPNSSNVVTANAASPILTVANINSKTFTIDGGSF